MPPVGPLKFKRMPESVRRQVEVTAASAWEALVEVHSAHALRFVALMSMRMPFDEAVSRYLAEMDVRDPMASSIRSRVLVALEEAERDDPDRPALPRLENGVADGEAETDGLRRFRPDRLMKDIARKVRETGAAEQWVALAIARAEEGVIRAHIDNAITLSAILRGHADLDEAVEEYIDLLRVTGGRAQAVFQRTMAQLADLHLPADPAGAAGRDEEAD
jgi:hypothetical protein